MLNITPVSYPVMEVCFNDINENEREDNLWEKEATFPREFWLNLANTLNQVAKDMGGDDPARSGFNIMSQRIMAEIEAEDRRLQFREAYEYFADFVVEITNRTDLDKVRKGQMVHDMASELRLEA
jgi:hypothetical protein